MGFRLLYVWVTLMQVLQHIIPNHLLYGTTPSFMLNLPTGFYPFDMLSKPFICFFYRFYKIMDVLMNNLANLTIDNPVAAEVVNAIHEKLVSDTVFMTFINKQLKHLVGKAFKE